MHHKKMETFIVDDEDPQRPMIDWTREKLSSILYTSTHWLIKTVLIFLTVESIVHFFLPWCKKMEMSIIWRGGKSEKHLLNKIETGSPQNMECIYSQMEGNYFRKCMCIHDNGVLLGKAISRVVQLPNWFNLFSMHAVVWITSLVCFHARCSLATRTRNSQNSTG